MTQAHSRSLLRRLLRWGLALLFVLIGALTAAYLFWDKLPYQSLTTRQVRSLLEQRGLTVNGLSVHTFTPTQTRLTDLSIGQDRVLMLNELDAQYQLPDILNGRFEHLSLGGLQLTAYATSSGWSVAGLEPIMPAGDTQASAPPLPFSAAQLQTIAPKEIAITDSTITVEDNDWQLTTPLMLAFTVDDAASLKLTMTLDATAKPYALKSDPLTLSATLDTSAEQWNGTMHTSRLHLTGTPTTIPPLAVDGQFALNPYLLTTTLDLRDTPGTTHAKLALRLPLDDTPGGSVKIRHLQFPWGQGMVSTRDVTLPLALNAPVPVTLQLENIDLAGLLNEISSGKVQATGLVNGAVPITWHPDGSITLQDGVAEAQEEGRLSVSADALPGEGAQMDTVRVALQDFHYTSFKITVSSDAKQRSVITLHVEGRNPDAFDGRPVKLNVNLTGDVLPLIQQTVLPFTDIKHWLSLQDTTP